MDYAVQFCRIIVITFLAEILHALLPLPVPASIYGIVLMFALLVSGILPLEKVKDAGKYLVAIMPVMFIPAAVGLLKTYQDILPNLFAYAVTLAVSTVAVMVVSGKVTQAVIRKGGNRHE